MATFAAGLGMAAAIVAALLWWALTEDDDESLHGSHERMDADAMSQEGGWD